MDVKVYEKEEVKQPKGTEFVYVPNVIDFILDIKTDTQGNEHIASATLITEDKDTVEQECGLATIWQRGLDPLDLDDGVRWSEALLEEITTVQLMDDLTNAVAQVTPTVNVVFDTATTETGQSVLKYTLQAVV